MPVEPRDPIAEISSVLHDEKPASHDARMHARDDAEVPTRKTTEKRARKYALEVNVEELYEQLRNKKHMAAISYRYQPEELQAMDALYSAVEEAKAGRMSKNDIARLAWHVLFDDYHTRGDASILMQVLRRM